MDRTFNKLYNLCVAHSFYTKNESEDFTFTPIGKSKKIMSTNGILFRGNSKGFDLLYQTIDEIKNPFIKIEKNESLKFEITLSNEKALYLTQLPDKFRASDIYYASDDYDNDTLALTVLPTRQPSFTESYRYVFETLTFRVVDSSGDICFETIEHGLEDEESLGDFDFSISVNLSADCELGKYKIQTINNGLLQDELEVYIINRLQYPNLIGVFELGLNSGIDYSSIPFEAKFDFESLATVWYYHIELTRDFKNGDFAITNGDIESVITFSETTSLDDYLIGETVIFKSSDVMLKNELPNINLSLKVTSDEIDLTLSGLPNPPHYNSQSIIYLKI